MRISRIKTVAIITLAIINALFLFVIISEEISALSERQQMLDGVSAIFEQNGISIDTKEIDFDGAQYSYTTGRDALEEREIAIKLFGDVSEEELGTNMISYYGEGGAILFHSSGEFRITMAEGANYLEENIDKAIESVLNILKIDSFKVNITGSAGSEIAEVTCAYENMPVFNSKVIFEFEDGALKTVTGKRISGVTRGEAQDSLTAETALVRFLPYAEQAGCTKVNSVTPGYLTTSVAMGDGSLNPAWNISTDAGEYYVNATNGIFEWERN